MSVTSTCFGQQYLSVSVRSNYMNLQEVVHSISPVIKVEYHNESIIVLKADSGALLAMNGTATPFWLAIDAVKHYGYFVNEIVKPEMGNDTGSYEAKMSRY